MVQRDATGIIASVAYVPDERTGVRPKTDAALFGAWCPVGIAAETAKAHLERIAGLLRREWPDASIELPKIVCAASRRDTRHCAPPWELEGRGQKRLSHQIQPSLKEEIWLRSSRNG